MKTSPANDATRKSKKYGATRKPKFAPARAPLRAKMVLLSFSLLIFAAVCEMGLRIFYRDGLGQVEDERSLTYRYDAELGWFPISNSTKRFTGSRTITVTHNSKGFRDVEPMKSDKPAVVFLGDSLVWGFDVEGPERFTDKLQSKHPEWSVYNFGISGYGTDQEYLLLQKYFDEYHPKVVFLVICGDNDNEDNAWNFRGGYYKPFYTLEGGRLKVNNVPVPKSERVFFATHNVLCAPYIVRLTVSACSRLAAPRPIRNPDPPTGALLLDMRKYVTERGALFVIGLQHSHPDIQKFLQDFNIRYVELETTNSAHVYPKFGNHWTPEGHTFVAEKIDRFLKK